MQGILDWIRNEPAVVSQVVGQALALGEFKVKPSAYTT